MADYSQHHSRAGRAGGLTRAALQTNEAGRIAAAASARMARYDAQVPDHITDPVKRAQAAHLLMRAHMTKLAKKSAEKRARPQPQRRRAA